jgi:hypothetical protein
MLVQVPDLVADDSRWNSMRPIVKLFTGVAILSVLAMSLACLGKKDGEGQNADPPGAVTDGDGERDIEEEQEELFESFTAECGNNTWVIDLTSNQEFDDVAVILLEPIDAICNQNSFCWSEDHPMEGSKKAWRASIDVVSSVLDVGDTTTVFTCDVDVFVVAVAYVDDEVFCHTNGTTTDIAETLQRWYDHNSISEVTSEVEDCMEDLLAAG